MRLSVRARPALIALGLITATAVGRAAESADPGLHTVTFEAYSPFTRNPEYLERVMTPLAFAVAGREAARAGRKLGGQLIDLSREQFVLYLPAHLPAAGYGLVAFIPPWADAKLPAGWAPVLDAQGIIFVSAARSGNEEPPLGRRVPLALLGAYNVMQRFPIDPKRRYVGGFSGGSRVALGLALDYPDVFAGALLIAGSDPIGQSPYALPAAALMARFEDSHIVYLSGSEDTVNIAMDAESLRSLKRHCSFQVGARILPWLGHTIADGRALAAGLRALSMTVPVDSGTLATCHANRARDRDAALGAVDSTLARGDTKSAYKLITRLDQSFGGLAAPQIVDLAERCNCNLLMPHAGTP